MVVLSCRGMTVNVNPILTAGFVNVILLDTIILSIVEIFAKKLIF